MSAQGCVPHGVSAWWGFCLVGGVQWVSAGGVYIPHVNRMTDRCKNITFHQTSFTNVNEKKYHFNIRNVYILDSVTWPENCAASLNSVGQT